MIIIFGNASTENLEGKSIKWSSPQVNQGQFNQSESTFQQIL